AKRSAAGTAASILAFTCGTLAHADAVTGTQRIRIDAWIEAHQLLNGGVVFECDRPERVPALDDVVLPSRCRRRSHVGDDELLRRRRLRRRGPRRRRLTRGGPL